MGPSLREAFPSLPDKTACPSTFPKMPSTELFPPIQFISVFVKNVIQNTFTASVQSRPEMGQAVYASFFHLVFWFFLDYTLKCLSAFDVPEDTLDAQLRVVNLAVFIWYLCS